MNHPEPQEWVPYLYGESGTEERGKLKGHLDVCPECRELLAGWRRSSKRLDAWRLPRNRTPVPAFVPAVKWGFAALVLLLAAFGVGRFTGTSAVRAKLEPELRQQLGQEMRETMAAMAVTVREEAAQMVAAYAKELQAERAADRQAIDAAFQRAEAQRITDIVSLKKELDTLAVNTDAGLRYAAADLVQLATYRVPPRASDPEQK